MRRIERETLALEAINALHQFQEDIDRQRGREGFAPGKHWDGNRRSQPILAVYEALKRMAGVTERCMYCVDSAGSDIEHFWPKTPHPEKMYQWANLLIACAPCGRFKGTQFPLSARDEPLLIDPSAENPWEFLDFDPETGNLNARYLLAAGEFSAKGEATVRVLRLDRREGVSAAYRRTYHRLCQLVSDWCNHRLEENYIEKLQDADDHGLLGWFLHGSGGSDPSFSRFRERYEGAWMNCLQRLS